MQRVSANVFAAAVIAFAFIGFSNLGAYADANPNNHGHHYGQLKHQNKHRPAPPAPAPGPAVNPSSRAAGTTTTAAVPLARSAPAAQPATLQIQIPIRLVVPTGEVPNASVKPIPPAPDPLWWLILVLPPTLVALWAIAFRRVVVAGSARGTTTAATD